MPLIAVNYQMGIATRHTIFTHTPPTEQHTPPRPRRPKINPLQGSRVLRIIPGGFISIAMGKNVMGNTQRLVPNEMVDACPPFAANLYRNWHREVKLRLPAQVGGGVRPNHRKIENGISAYLENAEKSPRLRSAGRAMDIPNRRFGRTDSERGWS